MKNQTARILVVDDNPLNLSLLQLGLEGNGYVVHQANSGKEAVQMAQNQPPDLILLDVRMPNMDGYETCQRLKADPQIKHIPVIFVSAAHDTLDKLKGFEAGGVDYINKPIEFDVLLARIELHIKTSRQQREIEQLREQDRHRIEHLNQEIQKRKKVEHALRKERDLAQQYLDIAGVIIVVLRPTGEILLLNKQGHCTLGYEAGELIGKNWFDVCLPVSHHKQVRYVFDQLKNDPDTPFEYHENPVLTKSGEEKLIRWHNACQFDDQSNLVSILASGEDITERKRTEAALQESEQRFRILFEQSPDAITLLNPHDPDVSWAIVDCNDQFCRMNGYTRDELLGQSVDVVHDSPEDPARRRAYLNRLRHDGTIIGYVNHRHKDGTLFPIRFSTGLINLNGQELIMGIDHDLTEQRRMEALEHEQRILAEALAETAAILNRVYYHDEVLERILTTVGRVVRHDAANIMLIEDDYASVVKQHGYATWTNEELMLTTRYRIADIANLRQMFDSKQPIALPTVDALPGWEPDPPADWIRSYAGAPIVIGDRVIGFLNLDSATPNFFTQHHANRLRAFADQAAIAIENARLYQELESYSEFLVQAVEERTAELQESEERYRTITRNLPHGMVHILDKELRYIFNDGEELKNLGLTHEMLNGKSIHEVLDPQTAILAEENYRRVLRGETVKFENEFKGQSFLTSAAPLISPSGEISQILVFSTNITDQKRAETSLRQTLEKQIELQEMQSRFVSMVSHDLRTPLAVIQSSTDMLAQYGHRLSEEKKLAKFTQIQTSIQAMVKLLNDVLIVRRIESQNLQCVPERIDLEAFCRSILRDFQDTIGAMHVFDFSIVGQSTTQMLDRKLLHHIIENLLSNAIKYSPTGSAIQFEVRCEEERVVFRIQDEGIGIPAKDQEQLFNTFFRATNVGAVSGTGLGLVIVKEAVDAHGGTLELESTEGVGTTVFVTIPYGFQGEAPQ